MMIQKLYSTPSFGKKLVGEFNITQKKLSGATQKLPVQVWRLESEEDFEDTFSKESVHNINMDMFFYNKKLDGPWTYDYVVTPKGSGRILGAADCIKEGDTMDIETIGTSKNKNYKGIGRALIAGIAQDIKEEITSLNVPFPMNAAMGFYDKCHFDYKGTVGGFCLTADDYDKVILDAKNQ